MIRFGFTAPDGVGVWIIEEDRKPTAELRIRAEPPPMAPPAAIALLTPIDAARAETHAVINILFFRVEDMDFSFLFSPFDKAVSAAIRRQNDETRSLFREIEKSFARIGNKPLVLGNDEFAVLSYSTRARIS